MSPYLPESRLCPDQCVTHCTIIIIVKTFLSQEASGTCDASQLPPDRLVLSITGVVGPCLYTGHKLGPQLVHAAAVQVPNYYFRIHAEWGSKEWSCMAL